MRTEAEISAEVEALVAWYKAIPEDLKRYLEFRARIQDPSATDLGSILLLAEKLARHVKKNRKQGKE